MGKMFEVDHLFKTITVANDEVLFLGIASLPPNEAYDVIMNGENVGRGVRMLNHSTNEIEVYYEPNEPIKSVRVTGNINI